MTGDRRSEALPLLWLLACLVFLLCRTWLRWGDLIIDTGRELSVPLELLSGRVLYRDLFYLYGPFSPYWNAGFMRLFGVGVGALVLSGTLATAAMAWLCFRVSRFFLGPWTSALCGVTYLFVLAFAHYESLGIFTHILPYAYPSVHGTALSLASVYCAMEWVRGGKRTFLVLCAAFAFLALLTRVEMGLMALAAEAAALAAAGRVREDSPRSAPSITAWTLVPAAAAALVYAGFWRMGSGAVEASGLFDLWAANLDPGRTMTGWVLGTVGLAGNLKLLGGSLVLHLLVLGTASLGSLRISLALAEGREALAWAAGSVSLALLILFASRGAAFDVQYRILPFLCAWMALAALTRLARGQGVRDDALILTLSLFALLFCGRMLFNVRPGHYGSHLLVPGLAVYFAALFRIAPRLAPEPGRGFFGRGMAVFALVSLASYFLVSEGFYRRRGLKVESPRGSLRVLEDDRGRRNLDLIGYLRGNAEPGDGLAVFPEGLGVNFFSGLPNPLYHYSYLPVDLARPGVEEAVAAGLGSRRVAWAAVVQRPSGEYGAESFGGDYGLLIRDRLLEDYDPVAGFGPPPFATPGYGVALFRRKPGR